jgi:hypothetical protein
MVAQASLSAGSTTAGAAVAGSLGWDCIVSRLIYKL